VELELHAAFYFKEARSYDFESPLIVNGLPWDSRSDDSPDEYA
jgi:hypothetical protein